ncbi:ADP-ribosyl cyclase/cyclic ADP-ribose hydrolase 1 [Apodemus speciosus]|uniref:ADP-ribosyl cyclase/cyclic ADP-ribose hydrolase 1 n=1 Tax=Apodemus speciosus TaxID=105296 RepID=A0ABQ0ERU7_APOSI
MDQDCKKILSTFKQAFVSKNPCNITREDYAPLAKLVTQTIPCNKTLFWSKSKHLAHQYTWIQGKMFTLEDTLLGYIADDLRWCGDPSTSDAVGKRSHWDWTAKNSAQSFDCPGPHSVGQADVKLAEVHPPAFASQFAEDACGVVQVMLNGSLSEPFYKNSTFGSVEVFNLDPNKVHKLQAWVMHDLEGASRDSDCFPPLSNSCSSSSINELKAIVQKRNMTFACQDNYRACQVSSVCEES